MPAQIFCSIPYVFFILLLSPRNVVGRMIDVGETHTVQVSSFLPSQACKPSAKVSDGRTLLKVVHRHGPCSSLSKDAAMLPELRLDDKSRLEMIQRRITGGVDLASASKSEGNIWETEKSSSLVHSGNSFDTGNYVVQVGLGTPSRQLNLVIDTGSDLCWTQCRPCGSSCYTQKDPLFDPSRSSTFSNVSCSSSLCFTVQSSKSCEGGTCVYGVQYGDGSYTTGYFATETLALSRSDVIENFYFGCGSQNDGLFGEAAGLFGLGKNTPSFVTQTANKYNEIFSYCLPSADSGSGFLSFGSARSSSVKYTPLISSSPLYGISISGISVGGKRLSIPVSAFSSPTSIIDSGTIISRLPVAAYSALQAAFSEGMSRYTKAPAYSILDTCYDMTGHESMSMPTVAFTFGGGATVNLDAKGIMIVVSSSQICLAFAGTESDGAIIGNVQQRTLEIVYDLANGRVGFANGACD